MIQPLISVITATSGKPLRRPLLQEAYKSLMDQQDGSGDFEWIIQVDGSREAFEDITELFAGDSRVKVKLNPYRVGPELARNLALNHAQGALIVSLDDDDWFPEEAFQIWTEEMKPRCHWVIGASSAYYTPERINYNAPRLPEGDCPAGELFKAWSAPEDPLPAWGAGMMIRKDLLRKVGGWQALPQGGEIGMLIAATCEEPGRITHRQVHMYRQYPDQYVGSDRFDAQESDIRKAIWLRGLAITQNRHRRDR